MNRLVVVRPNYRRRHGIARNMAAAGWPHWAICRCLALRPERLATILNGTPLWGADTETLRAAVAEELRRAA